MVQMGKEYQKMSERGWNNDQEEEPEPQKKLSDWGIGEEEKW